MHYYWYTIILIYTYFLTSRQSPLTCTSTSRKNPRIFWAGYWSRWLHNFRNLNDERVILKNEKAFSGILVFIKRQLINEIAYFDFSAPVEQKLEVIPGVAPAVNLNVIGMSSEWFGNSNHGATTFQNERKSFERSKVRKNSLEFSFPAKFPVPYISYECLY